MMFIHSRLPSWKGVYLLMTITRALNDNEESSDDERIQPSPRGDYDDNGDEWPQTRAWLQNYKIASVYQVKGKSAFNFFNAEDLPWTTMAMRHSKYIIVLVIENCLHYCHRHCLHHCCNLHHCSRYLVWHWYCHCHRYHWHHPRSHNFCRHHYFHFYWLQCLQVQAGRGAQFTDCLHRLVNTSASRYFSYPIHLPPGIYFIWKKGSILKKVCSVLTKFTFQKLAICLIELTFYSDMFWWFPLIAICLIESNISDKGLPRVQ